MKTKLQIATISLCLLASSTAMANDAVWGALLGGGAGAAIGSSVSGRNGAIVGGAIGAAAGAAIVGDNGYRRVEYLPATVYQPRTVYYAPQPVYYAAPVPVVAPTVYYVGPGPRGHHHPHYWRGYR